MKLVVQLPLATLGFCAFIQWALPGEAAVIDLSRAVVIAPSRLTGPESNAVRMLIEEVEKRTQVRWTRSTTWPAAHQAVIAIGPVSALKDFAGDFADEFGKDVGVPGTEGYRIRMKQRANHGSVFIIGNDSRGVLFGVGRLLRALHMSPGSITLDDDFSVSSSPKYSLRGHQLGYRPKTHSYDAWD